MQVVRPPSADGGTGSPQQQRQAPGVAARLGLAALAASLAMCAPPSADAFPAAAAAAAPSGFAGSPPQGFRLAAAGNPAVLRGIERMESGNLAAEDGTPAPTTQQRETNKLQVGYLRCLAPASIKFSA